MPWPRSPRPMPRPHAEKTTAVIRMSATLDESRSQSTVARRTRMSGVRVEPVGDPASVLDAMLRLPTAGKVVVVLREPYEHGLLPEDLQGREQLLGLLNRAAQVSFGMEDEKRRLHAGHVGEWRTEYELLAAAPRGRIAHLVLPEVPSDVARTER